MSSTLQWFKSSYSSDSGGECLEVAFGTAPRGVRGITATVHVRDSKVPGGPALTVAADAWRPFLTAPHTSHP